MDEGRVLLLVGGPAAAVVLGLSALISVDTTSAGDMRRIGGPLAMTEMTGHPIAEAALSFGSTRCPATCPVTPQAMADVLGRMGRDADRVAVVFLAVDPRIRGFFGTEAQVAAMADAFKIRCRRVPLEDGDDTVDHTAAVIPLDARGRFAGAVTSDDDETAIADRPRDLVASASRSAGGSPAGGG